MADLEQTTEKEKTLFIIEDDKPFRERLTTSFQRKDFVVTAAANKKEALEVLTQNDFNYAIVDLRLGDGSGLDVIKVIKEKNPECRAVMLTSYGNIATAVSSVKLGADDYLTKPFAPSELLARVDALGRRGGTEAPITILKVGDLEMNLLARTVKRGEESIDLQPREFRLLEFLMRNAGQVVTRTMLLEKVWDYHFDPQTNVIDVHISRLRGKIDKDFDRPLLHTVRGAGYRLQA